MIRIKCERFILYDDQDNEIAMKQMFHDQDLDIVDVWINKFNNGLDIVIIYREEVENV